LEMKDAGGHGSNTRGGTAAHATGVDQVGRPPLSPQVVQHILAHPEGFTIDLKGGQPTSGYQVAIPGHALTAPLSGDPAHGEATLQAWAQAHAGALKTAGHVGGYRNETTGNYEIEPSQNIKNKNAAYRTGVSRNQESIWDVRKSRTIMTGGTGK
jgi:hypothetical protein